MWTYSYDGISLQNQRAVNMDSLLLKTRMIQGRNFCIAVVCDGVGSMQDGQFAAVTAVTLLNHWFTSMIFLVRFVFDYISVAFAWVFVILYAIVGPMILG